MNRIARWILAGVCIALGWVMVAHLWPGVNLGRSSVVYLTAPAAWFGHSRPLGMLPFVLLNGVLYGMVGLAIRALRRNGR